MGVLQPVLDLVRKFKGSQTPENATVKLDKSVITEKIKETSVLADLPAPNLDAMYAHMEVLKVPEGQVVIREGTEGDYYYVLAQGRARVDRRNSAGETESVAEINEPHGFGEEALISNRTRNATVTMTSDGILLRISKEAFGEYVKKPLVKWLFQSEAQLVVSQGGRWVDTRDAGEARLNRLPEALLIPLDAIRDRAKELEKNVPYVCYCQNGRLSSTAAFLLRIRGYDAAVLRGGLQAMKGRP